MTIFLFFNRERLALIPETNLEYSLQQIFHAGIDRFQVLSPDRIFENHLRHGESSELIPQLRKFTIIDHSLPQIIG